MNRVKYYFKKRNVQLFNYKIINIDTVSKLCGVWIKMDLPYYFGATILIPNHISIINRQIKECSNKQ